ncbi:MAG: glutamate racemase [Succinivibrionaceae bacterium]
MCCNILFFDSGVGGLSVYNSLKNKYNYFNVSYLFDNLCYPYGIQPDDVVVNRVVSLLLNFYKNHKVDLIVLACNTASTVALDTVRKVIPVPVVGVVPAIKPAAKLTRNGVVGLLATPATIRRPYTNNLINNFANNVKVLKIGTTELVDIAERKLAGLPYEKSIINSVLDDWISLSENEQPDTIVLGCTHFPHLKTEISNIFPKATLVDSGDAIARRVLSILNIEINDDNNSDKNKILSENLNVAYYTDKHKYSEVLASTFNHFGFYKLELLG